MDLSNSPPHFGIRFTLFPCRRLNCPLNSLRFGIDKGTQHFGPLWSECGPLELLPENVDDALSPWTHIRFKKHFLPKNKTYHQLPYTLPQELDRSYYIMKNVNPMQAFLKSNKKELPLTVSCMWKSWNPFASV